MGLDHWRFAVGSVSDCLGARLVLCFEALAQATDGMDGLCSSDSLRLDDTCDSTNVMRKRRTHDGGGDDGAAFIVRELRASEWNTHVLVRC